MKKLNWVVATAHGRHFIQDDSTGGMIFEVYGPTRDARESLSDMVVCVPQMVDLIQKLLDATEGDLPPETYPLYEAYEIALETLKKIQK